MQAVNLYKCEHFCGHKGVASLSTDPAVRTRELRRLKKSEICPACVKRQRKLAMQEFCMPRNSGVAITALQDSRPETFPSFHWMI